MNWYIHGHERLTAPPEYQEYLTAIGGRNRFGDPNFILEWGQTALEVVRGTDAFGRNGAHTILKHGGIAAWFVAVWKPPECFGTPEFWYAISWDWENEEPTLGEYPWRGLYMPAPFNLYVKKMTGGGHRFLKNGEVVEEPAKLEIDAMPLNYHILDLLIPNLMKAQEETFEQKRIAIQNRMITERAAANKQAMDAYLDAAPAFHGNDFTGASNREAWLQRIAEKQAGMKVSRDQIVRKLGSGHRQTRRVIK